MEHRPKGRVTFLLTDIEGSTRLLRQLGGAYGEALAQHHRLMRSSIAESGGSEIKTEGDSFFVVFPDAPSGLRAAVDAQRRFAAASWPDGASFAVRMGLHTGEVAISDGEYVGMELNRAARIAATAHGGQIVVSAALRDAVGSDLPEGASFRDLGEHRLKDFEETIELWQVDVAGLRTEFPPLTSLSARFELLPPELSRFVGRDDDVAHVSDLLSGARLLTMTGPGGTGKTRLALQAARHCEASYPQGVAFVPLAPVTDAKLVASTIRGTLGFAEEPGQSSVETLSTRLRQHELLLILDNFEQVMPAAGTVASLLAGTERLTVMVTSRASLHLDGEQEYQVSPLGVPRTDQRLDIDEIAATEAVRLFVDRAQRARPGFRLDAANAGAVAEICRRLDGLPLAIELAASRVKLLSPDQLLTRLGSRMDALRTSGTASAERRRTLRGTIDWSHDLLGPTEQATFRRLAIFTGGASLEAVEAVVPMETDGEAAPDVFDSLEQLVDHSLLRSDDPGGEPRFVMLETIREYGLERLAEAGETDVIAAAHARFYLARVEQLAPSFTSDPAALDAIETDHANVRAALRHASEHGAIEDALRGVGFLWRFWQLRGHLAEGLGICDEILARPGATERTEASAAALYARASVRYWMGDTSGARPDYEASLAAAEAAGARAREAEAHFALTYIYLIVREFDAAHASAEAASTIYDELGDALGSTNARYAYWYASSLAGDWEQAAEGFRSLIAEVETSGDRFWVMNNRITLAWTLIRLGRIDEASDIVLSNLEGSIEMGDPSMEQMAIQAMGMIAAHRGDTERALHLAGAADAIAERYGGKAPPELVIADDPATLARDGGVDEAEVERLTAEGRAMSVEDVRSLARSV